MTIAGSDLSGGVGLQADTKTFHQHGVYATTVVTLLTVQNTQAVSAVRLVELEFVLAQLDAVLDDMPPACGKTGALGSSEMIAAIADRAVHFAFPLVVDPVMISKHGQPLLDDNAVRVLVDRLVPLAFLITPNRFEAERMTGITIRSRQDMASAAAAIGRQGANNVLIKGGDLAGQSVDLLWAGGRETWLCAPRLQTRALHGSGCVFSAAITARLALGDDLLTAATQAKRFITSAIQTAPGLGQGLGPVNIMTDTHTIETVT